MKPLSIASGKATPRSKRSSKRLFTMERQVASTEYEIKRDLNALIEDFGHLEERLNAESMKR